MRGMLNGMKAPRPATIISLVALFVALSGTAVAVSDKVKRSQIAPRAVSAPKLAKGAVKGQKLQSGAVKPRHLDGATAAALSGMTTEELTAAGVPVLLAQERFPGVYVNATDGMTAKIVAGPIEVDAPGPITVEIDMGIRKEGVPDIDLHGRLNGGDSAPFIDALLGDWPSDYRLHTSWNLNTAPGTHEIDIKAIVFQGTEATFGAGEGTLISVYTAPPAADLGPGDPIPPPD